MNNFLSPFAPENLVSRDGFSRPRPALACSFSILTLNLVLTHGIPPDFRDSVQLFITAIRHRASPEFIESRNCVPLGLESAGTGSVVLKVFPVTGAGFAVITMDQVLCASIFPIHYNSIIV